MRCPIRNCGAALADGQGLCNPCFEAVASVDRRLGVGRVPMGAGGPYRVRPTPPTIEALTAEVEALGVRTDVVAAVASEARTLVVALAAGASATKALGEVMRATSLAMAQYHARRALEGSDE